MTSKDLEELKAIAANTALLFPGFQKWLMMFRRTKMLEKVA